MRHDAWVQVGALYVCSFSQILPTVIFVRNIFFVRNVNVYRDSIYTYSYKTVKYSCQQFVISIFLLLIFAIYICVCVCVSKNTTLYYELVIDQETFLEITPLYQLQHLRKNLNNKCKTDYANMLLGEVDRHEYIKTISKISLIMQI